MLPLGVAVVCAWGSLIALRWSLRDLRTRAAEGYAPAWAQRCLRELERVPGLRRAVWVKLNALATALARDRRSEAPPSDAEFRRYTEAHSYATTDLDAITEGVKVSAPWRREDITFNAAYENDRVLAHLFLPSGGKPPYPVVAVFEGAEALTAASVQALGTAHFDFVIRSGRAVLLPAYNGTLERGPAEYYHRFGRSEKWKQMNLQWSKDLSRSLDYLETRPDIDMRRPAFMGISIGAAMAPRLVAIEHRLRAAILVSGGAFERVPAEVDSWNFAPRVRIPVLMVNGRDDHNFPLLTSQEPLFERFGTPASQKRRVVFEGGHIMPGENREMDQIILEWLAGQDGQ